MSKRTGTFISALMGATALAGCGEPLTGQDEVAKKWLVRRQSIRLRNLTNSGFTYLIAASFA